MDINHYKLCEKVKISENKANNNAKSHINEIVPVHVHHDQISPARAPAAAAGTKPPKVLPVKKPAVKAKAEPAIMTPAPRGANDKIVAAKKEAAKMEEGKCGANMKEGKCGANMKN